MKILVLGLNYAPEPVGIGPYTTGFAEWLAARGHDVTVVAGKPYYPQWQPYDGWPKGRVERVEEGVRVTRVPHYVPASPGGFRRIAHHLSFARSAHGPMMRVAREKPDLVFAVAPSLISAPVAARAARKAGAPHWLHVQDFEAEAALATGLLNEASPTARLARGTERALLGLADFVSAISPQMREKLAAKGIPPQRTMELRNWSTFAFDGADEAGAAYRREWDLGERHVALYSGNIANKQGLELVIEAARQLARRDDVVFLICGEGPNRGRLEALSAGLSNIRFYDLQPAARMGELLSLASVHLLPQITGAADLVLPSKLTNMLASGRPVVATAARGTGLFAEIESCGIATPPGDAQAMAEAVARLVDDRELRTSLGSRAAERARSRWSKDAILGEFETRAEELVARGTKR